ncbi:MAG: SDR family NAD(P)-dependent oxidoreductase [Segniliparus sp.]|uniref:SDR family NAD(P)-dependent oxidoreductase n=1 Tax=Segniliparus sp. TaxID=2804064 RepID=UPI003F3D5D0B
MAHPQSHAPYLWLDKTVLITGAGQRVGRELGELLAGKGARVWLGTRKPEEFDQLVGMLRTRCRNITAIALDIADDESIAEAVAEVGRREGRIDVLINIADIAPHRGNPALGLDKDMTRACLDVNFVGPWLAAQHALPLLRRSCSAMVVNVTSGMDGTGFEEEPAPERGGAGNRAPAAGLHLLSRVVATELRMEAGLRKSGAVRILSVAPPAGGAGMAAAEQIVAAIARPSSEPSRPS